MDEKKLYTITVFSENQVGLLNRISIIFTRRCLNIESLTGSPSSIPGVHKVTITCFSDRATLENVVKQIERLVDVLKSFLYTDDEIVYQEIALYKVPTDRFIGESDVEDIIRRHGARVLHIAGEYTVIEKTGHEDETLALFNELQKYGITQYVRSGRVAVTKSTAEYVTMFIDEQRKRMEELKND